VRVKAVVVLTGVFYRYLEGGIGLFPYLAKVVTDPFGFVTSRVAPRKVNTLFVPSRTKSFFISRFFPYNMAWDYPVPF